MESWIAMKPGLFIAILIVAAFGIAAFIYAALLPDYIKAGGPLVVLLITLSIMVVTFVAERLLALTKARGKGNLERFLAEFQGAVDKDDLQGALGLCDRQRGTAANVLRAGLAEYVAHHKKGAHTAKQLQEYVEKAVDKAMALEVPQLERNLTAISTIASISTLTGLLGTTLGMIRAFKALAKSGAPDAIALSLGISEALVNTAGGLFAAIVGIVAYNYFVTRVDNFTYAIDEANDSMARALAERGAGA